MILEQTASQRRGNIKPQLYQSLIPSPSHLKAQNSFEDQFCPTNKLLKASTQITSQSFTFTNQQIPSNNNATSVSNLHETSYVPPSPLQLWKIGRTDAIDDNDCVKDTTETHLLHEDSTFNSMKCNPKILKDTVAATVHSSSFTPTSQPTTPANNIQNVTPKKRGQVR